MTALKARDNELQGIARAMTTARCQSFDQLATWKAVTDEAIAIARVRYPEGRELIDQIERLVAIKQILQFMTESKEKLRAN